MYIFLYIALVLQARGPEIPVIKTGIAVFAHAEAYYFLRHIIQKRIVKAYLYIMSAFFANMIFIVIIRRFRKAFRPACAAQYICQIHMILPLARTDCGLFLFLNNTIII